MRMQGDSPESEFLLGDDGSEAESSRLILVACNFILFTGGRVMVRRKGYGIS